MSIELRQQDLGRRVFLVTYVYKHLYVFASSLCILVCSAFGLVTADITTTQFLRDPEALVSSNNNFKLGFFGPINSTNRFVGIWYNKGDSGQLEVVWVANRNNPLSDTSGVLKVSNDGNLQLLDGKDKVFWSTNVSDITNASVAQLLDFGKLVLLTNANGSIIWQSFDHPTDTMLPPDKFAINKTIELISWKSPSDPSSGQFTCGIYHYQLPEFAIRDGDKPYWRSGPWNGYLFLGVPYMTSEIGTGFGIIKNPDDTLEVSYTVSNQSILEHFVLSYDGRFYQKQWDGVDKKFVIVWQSMESPCDIYGICGPFGICNPRKSPICDCLKGFKPKNNEEWSKGNWSGGCLHDTPLQCGNTTKGDKSDGFLMLKHVKVPDNPQWLLAGEDNCKSKCLENCSCSAYSFYSGIGCMVWTEKLVDIQQFLDDGADLFIRLAQSEPGRTDKWKMIIPVVVILGTAAFVASFCIWRWINQRHGKKLTKKGTLPYDFKFDSKLQEFALMEFEKLVVATNNFSESNKLGRGGFGVVYKGKLENGQQIAVKRLSKATGQGLQEFMNEVAVISKLQHKNLVRLLGCCAEGEENLLVFEYMPNKSLNALLFDPLHRGMLDWKKRFNIIKGICRGLLYLHRDSRLKIIHRDLKASNILLDDYFNPKISDFGTARIFDSKQDEENTLRIIGTYGYMSPEYAMEGRFSEKSDVFSFGVLLLEIVSGRRNRCFETDESHSLLAHAWKLWNEDNIFPLIDSTICNPSFQGEILRCILVALLCVQEFAEDRPDMSAVMSMFNTDDVINIHPTQPGFSHRKVTSTNTVSRTGGENCSVNYVSITDISGLSRAYTFTRSSTLPLSFVPVETKSGYPCDHYGLTSVN